MSKFHVSNLGAFGENIPCDLDGYCHLTAEGWLSAPVDALIDQTEEWAEEMAAEANEALTAANAAHDSWLARN